MGVTALRYEDIEDKHEGFNLLKDYVRSTASVEASFYFYLASALHKSARIQALLKEQWVICDRYVYSTIAYHVAKGFPRSAVPDLAQLPLKMPDYFFLVTVSERERLQRVSKKIGATTDDAIPKSLGNEVQTREDVFKSFNPLVIDNSENDPQISLNVILKYLKSEGI